MTATRLDIVIDQGADYGGSFDLGYDLTGYSAAMQIKYAPDYPSAILTLTTANGGLVIDPTAGSVTPVIPASVTTLLDPGRFVYDLKMFSPGGATTRVYQGNVCVSPQVTDVIIMPPTFMNWDAGGQWDSGLSWDANVTIIDWDAGGQWDNGLSWDAG